MNYLMNSIMFVLALCVIGTLILVIVASGHIYREIYNHSKSKGQKGICEWTGNDDLSDYKTQCGHKFYDASESGNPITDALTYCPYCGRAIKAI